MRYEYWGVKPADSRSNWSYNLLESIDPIFVRAWLIASQFPAVYE